MKASHDLLSIGKNWHKGENFDHLKKGMQYCLKLSSEKVNFTMPDYNKCLYSYSKYLRDLLTDLIDTLFAYVIIYTPFSQNKTV